MSTLSILNTQCYRHTSNWLPLVRSPSALEVFHGFFLLLQPEKDFFTRSLNHFVHLESGLIRTDSITEKNGWQEKPRTRPKNSLDMSPFHGQILLIWDPGIGWYLKILTAYFNFRPQSKHLSSVMCYPLWSLGFKKKMRNASIFVFLSFEPLTYNTYMCYR